LPLPAGYTSMSNVGFAYDIATTAGVSGPITTCIAVPTVDDQAVFNNLRLLHLENDVLVDRTILPADFATRTICASTTSLSPFVIVQQVDANRPAIDGLVQDADGQPLSDVTVDMTGDLTLTTQTDINGRFTFANLPVGGNYVVTPRSDGVYSYTPSGRTFNDVQASQGEVFTAAPCSFGLSAESANFDNTGGIGSFDLNSAGGCTWIATTDDPWITITSAPGGSGTGAIQYSVDVNPSGARTGTIQAGGETFTITQAAARVQVGGRVQTSDGRGIRNAVVSITDSHGVKRAVTTSSLGFYRFDEIEAGDTYIIRVASKQYRFASQNVQPFGSLTNVDFVGLE